MKIIEVEQGSQEWLLSRCGLPTASGFDKIITAQGKPSTQRQKYLYQLAGERILERPEETYKNLAMQRGTEMEPEARSFYEMISGETVTQVGFCLADSYGASPDGLVGEDGMVEIKCPLVSTHVSYLLNGTFPTEYFQQVQGEILVTGRKWCDFLSYFPGLKPLLVRAFPDPEFQRKLQVELELFCVELDLVVGKLKQEETPNVRKPTSNHR